MRVTQEKGLERRQGGDENSMRNQGEVRQSKRKRMRIGRRLLALTLIGAWVCGGVTPIYGGERSNHSVTIDAPDNGDDGGDSEKDKNLSTGGSDIPKTGNENPAYLWIGMILLALGGMLLCFYGGKKVGPPRL